MRTPPLEITLALALALASGGCKPNADATADAASAAAVTSAAAAAPVGGSAAAPTKKAADGASKTLEGPAWPTGAAPELKLTWAVYPPTGQGEGSTRNLEIVARIGDVVRRAPLGAVKGALLPGNQSVCGDKQVAYKKMAGEVAKITFDVGGASTFVVKQARPGILEVERIQGADGYCPMNDCDTKTTVLTIPIPADARIVEAISDIQGAGKEGPFDCGPDAPTTAGSAGAAVTCKAPQAMGYDMETGKAFCGPPCKADKDCAAAQTCVMANKSNEPTMGMAAARANEIYLCATKAPRPAASAPRK